MQDLWNKSKDTNLLSNGEKVKEFRFRPNQNNSPYDKQQVYARADALRLKLEQFYPGEYSMSVAVRDRHVGGWRSGKFNTTGSTDIYIWSPELYDKEFNDGGSGIELPELKAEEMVIYVKRERPMTKK